MGNRLLIVLLSAGLVSFAGSVCLGAEGGNDAVSMVLEILRGDDEEMHAVAIGMVKEMQGPEVTAALAKELPGLSAASQVQLLAVLGDRGDAVALGAVVEATKAGDGSVRAAALRALGQLGDASTAVLLAEAAADSKGDECKAARESLYRLRGEGVDEAIIAALGKAESKSKVELITSLGQRNVRSGVASLLETAKDSDRKVRIESFKVLSGLGLPKDLPALVDLLVGVKSDSDRTEAEKTVAAVAHKIEKKDSQAAAVLAKLPSVKDVKVRSSLLVTLGRIGDNSGLGAVRKELKSEEAAIQTAAIRALSSWPSPEPVPDLLKLSRESKVQLHQILALRGLVRLLGVDEKRPAAERIAMYKEAMGLAPNAMEKRRVLSGLGGMPNLDSLAMASDYLGDKDLCREAEVAVVTIAGGIQDAHPKESGEALKKVIAQTKSDSVREQAQELLNPSKDKDDEGEESASQ
ncbi:MAG: HEAT repeat domain-containing protein [Sedimentisphaerales bacterium]|nr:HEAT repeat domain-containing protein [Sedimentisphaerales bacterium]